MDKFRFMINETPIELQDFGDPMNRQFMIFYKARLTNRSYDIIAFEEEALRTFDKYTEFGHHDAFFNNFTPLWSHYLQEGDLLTAESVWQIVLEISERWEFKNNKRIHKGTPYYFWSSTHILLKGSLEKAFLLMHQALTEDRDSWGTRDPPTPTYAFVTLDYDHAKQFLRSYLMEIAKFVEKKITEFTSARGGTLTLDVFKSKFLKSPNLQDVVFYSVFGFFHLERLDWFGSSILENDFGSLLETRVLFDFNLVIDKLIEKKNPNPPRNKKSLTFAENIHYLASLQSLIFEDNKYKKIRYLNERFQFDFSLTLKEILDQTFKFPDGRKLNEIEGDIAICYGFRNLGAHRIEHVPIIYNNFNELSNRVLNFLFYIVGKLY